MDAYKYSVFYVNAYDPERLFTISARVRNEDLMLEKDDSYYQSNLTQEQYQVTRLKATEPPFTGIYWDSKTDGVYNCICCETPLFKSDTKYESGSGWPSFWQPINLESIETEVDNSLGMQRTEVSCKNCGAHLGHVFPDGPPTHGATLLRQLSIFGSKTN